MLASMENQSSDVSQSGGISKTTRVEWMPGVHFIFITERRELKRTELDELCKKYFGLHRAKTRPTQALLVDLTADSPSYCAVPIDEAAASHTL
jgi:hypothetical protein